MERDRRAPEILGRLRSDAQDRLQAPKAPRWAAPVGWMIVVAILALAVVMIVTANPL